MKDKLALAVSAPMGVLFAQWSPEVMGDLAREVGKKNARYVTVQDLIRYALAQGVTLPDLISSGAPPPGRSTEV